MKSWKTCTGNPEGIQTDIPEVFNWKFERISNGKPERFLTVRISKQNQSLNILKRNCLGFLNKTLHDSKKKGIRKGKCERVKVKVKRNSGEFRSEILKDS